MPPQEVQLPWELLEYQEKLSVKTQVVIERLLILHRGTTIISATSFNNLIGTLAERMLLMGRSPDDIGNILTRFMSN